MTTEHCEARSNLF